MALIERGRLLAGAASILSGIAIVRAPARAAQFEYRMAHTLPNSHPQHVRLVQMWEAINKETNGRISVAVFPNSQLGGQESMIGQVRAGAIQFLSVGDQVWSDVVPATAIGSVGFAFKDGRQAWTVMTGPLGEVVRREFAAKGLYKPRGAIFDLGMREVTSSTKPIKTVADFTGFKIRVPPAKIAVDMFRTLGASTISLAQNEVYTGLQTHIADGQETPYLTIEQIKLYEVQKYLSVTNHVWTGNSFVANAASWKDLPPDIQAVIERNVAKYCLLARNDSWQLNAALADKLKRLGMIFNNVDTESMRVKLAPYYGRWKNEFGPNVWGLLESGVGKLG